MSRTAFNELIGISRPSPLMAVAEALSALVHAVPHCNAKSVPISVKANVAVRSFPTDAASLSLLKFTSSYSASVIERLQAEGGQVVAITNMDEFGMGSASQNSAHGRCLNPWSPALAAEASFRSQTGISAPSGPLQDMTRRRGWLVPGGSSGGAAVSIAVGSCTLAVGSDTGGSVRQPAAFNGCIGLKPSYGRIPRWGLIAYASSLDTIGLMGSSVWTVAAGYSVAAGRDARDASSVQCAHDPWTTTEVWGVLGGDMGGVRKGPSWLMQYLQVGRPLEGLRVGVPREYAPSSSSTAASDTWERSAQLLAQAGATIVEVSLPATRLALPSYYVLAPAEAASNLSRYDGVRYGYRAEEKPPGLDPHDDSSGTGELSQASASAHALPAQALHDLYMRTRSEGFGDEVQRRVMLGNFVLTQSARAEYFDAAVKAMECVRADFGGVFRPLQGRGPFDAMHAPTGVSLGESMNPASHPSAAHNVGVDILLTPVTPCPPWSVRGCGSAGVSEEQDTDPLREYMQDVMTIPASLAHLPACTVPVSTTPCSEDLSAAAAEDAAVAWGRKPREVAEFAARARGLDSLVRTRLPMSVQLVGRYCDEVTLLRVAAVLEARAEFQQQVEGRKVWEKWQ